MNPISNGALWTARRADKFHKLIGHIAEGGFIRQKLIADAVNVIGFDPPANPVSGKHGNAGR
jgi:hypothetical protein